MKAPTVSVIIPNYNHAVYLNQRLDSVFAQSYEDFEVIILDDCSTDNSKEVIEQYREHPKVSQIIYNTTNSGSTFRQWQKGIAEAQGKYIWIAESDDVAHEQLLATLVGKITENERLGVVYSESVLIDKNSQQFGTSLQFTEQFKPNIWQNDFQLSGVDFVKNYLIKYCVIPNASAALFRKEAYLQMNDNHLGMRLAGDWLVWTKILAKYDVAYIAKPYNFFRKHAQTASATTKDKLYWIESLMVLAEQRNFFLHQQYNQLYQDQLALVVFNLSKYFLLQKDTELLKQILPLINAILPNEKYWVEKILSDTQWHETFFVEIYQGNWLNGVNIIRKLAIRDNKPIYYLKNTIYWLWQRLKK